MVTSSCFADFNLFPWYTPTYVQFILYILIPTIEPILILVSHKPIDNHIPKALEVEHPLIHALCSRPDLMAFRITIIHSFLILPVTIHKQRLAMVYQLYFMFYLFILDNLLYCLYFVIPGRPCAPLGDMGNGMRAMVAVIGCMLG